ncbi:5,6-dimethylbenzimidazole synthase [Cognatishimia activa]|uniref:NADH dehydrogenase n=1 Tax=Cognatishimia activa TaxID=1715691 RepID=A0A0P1IUL1_9RHOB|nr:5,6-dimethylbenzimidazole synthase [Cognatishimia activa]CUI46935.1 NADH dehydrogenase [Cognatishimia activa]CUK27274.1 NADH dehydrogenase [Cognatishimia activa]
MQSFSKDFQSEFARLLRWRRDVRRFRTDPVDEALLQECLDAFLLAPSVGLSEPWRIVRVESEIARANALKNFQAANAEALAGYRGEKAKTYAGLKLSGMSDAPVQLAIYCDEATVKGAGLGAKTMPEMRRYSVVGAVNLFWLTARARGLGVGWVSILDPEQLNKDLDVPSDWSLVAYLCVGLPEEVSKTPELEQLGWEDRRKRLSIETR